jgi:hypothetical protein
MTALQEQVWDALVSLDSETLLRTFTDYHGLQIFDEDFAEFLVDEGLMEPEVIGRGGEDEEGDEETPEDEDYVVREERDGIFVGIIGGSPLGTFTTHVDAQAAITSDMKERNFYPNVWQESDHGNISRYKMDMV